MPLRVYVSSTYKDLASFRAVIEPLLRQAGFHAIGMEDYPAFEERPLEKCLKDVRACDVYVGVLAWRYGYIPSVENEAGKSITELEYDEAGEAQIPRLMFLLDPEAPWPRLLDDALTGEAAAGARIRALREAVARDHGIRHFATADQLGGLVLAALQSLVDARGQSPPPELAVERIIDFSASKAKVKSALLLYEDRLPADERYDREQMVELVRRHLTDEFGPSWTMYFLVAIQAARTVGLLICYEDVSANFAFISYLVTHKPRFLDSNRTDVSEALVTALVEERVRLGLPSPRFIFEVDHPALAPTPPEQRRRLARLKLFEGMAPFEALRVRAFDLRYLQPALGWPQTEASRELLLCYAAPGLQRSFSKVTVTEILTWVYTHLYAEDIFEDPDTRVGYGGYIRQLRDAAVAALPDEVRLLRSTDLPGLRVETGTAG